RPPGAEERRQGRMPDRRHGGQLRQLRYQQPARIPRVRRALAGAAVVILAPDLRDIERTSQSNAERRLARLLAEIPSLGGVAFYSVKLRSHAYKQMAEADFVILWKGVVIVVEVKGGGVKKFEGAWYSVDRNGDSHRLASSPM